MRAGETVTARRFVVRPLGLALALAVDLGAGCASDPSTFAAAALGRPEAQAAHAEALLRGSDYRRADPEAAVAWHRRAAIQGHLPSALAVARLLDQGARVLEDDREAERFWRLAAERGVAEAQFALARLLGLGASGEPNAMEAALWLRRAAEQGHLEAQFRLGEAYATGRSVAPHPAEAERWLAQAASRGHTGAERALGLLWAERAATRDERITALQWLLAASGAGDSEALRARQGLEARLSKADVAAAQAGARALRAARVESAEAGGAGVAEIDVTEVSFGVAARIDPNEAYERAKPRARSQDPLLAAEAVELFEVAAAQHHVSAMVELALCHAEGRGVPADLAEARRWLDRAAAFGVAPERLRGVLAQSQTEPGRALARNWSPPSGRAATRRR
jgi:hypothetical protein